MDRFVNDCKRYFHERKLFRWFVFTYPKTTILITTGLISGYIYGGSVITKEMKNQSRELNNAFHAENNQTKRSNNILIYDGSSKQ
jgi:hypothetical protein